MSELWVLDATDVVGDYSLGSVGAYGGGSFNGAAQGVIGAKEGMSTLVESMRVLGAGTDGLLEPLVGLSAALQVTAGAYQLYKGAMAAVSALRAAQEAAAAVEGAAAAANPFMWPNLVIAGAAMAATYATFQFASGEWQLPPVDLSNESQRDAAARQLTEVR